MRVDIIGSRVALLRLDRHLADIGSSLVADGWMLELRAKIIVLRTLSPLAVCGFNLNYREAEEFLR